MNKYFIIIDGIFAPVVGDAEEYFKLNKLNKSLAYTHDNHCYIYGGKLKNNPEYGFFYKDNKKLVYFKAKEFESTHVDNIKELTDIEKELCNPDYFKERSFQDELRDLTIFSPSIKENDDPFKRMIKLVLEDLQMEIKEISRYFNKEYETSNLKGTLTRDAILSSKNLLKWIELLKLKVTIKIETKEDAIKSLSKPIVMTID